MRQTKEGRQSLPILLPLSVCNYLMKKRIKKKILKGEKKVPTELFLVATAGLSEREKEGLG